MNGQYAGPGREKGVDRSGKNGKVRWSRGGVFCGGGTELTKKVETTICKKTSMVLVAEAWTMLVVGIITKRKGVVGEKGVLVGGTMGGT